MAQSIGILLRNAMPDMVDRFLDANGLGKLELPAAKRARTEPINAFIGDLLSGDDDSFARLEYEAGRIEDIAKREFDWVFAKYLDVEAKAETEEFSQRDKAVWIYIHRPDDFAEIERHISFDHLSATKTKHTKFFTVADCRLSDNSAKMAEFEDCVKAIYKAHDGSGRYAVTHKPWTDQEGGRRHHIYSLDVSQPPTHLARFDDDGDTRTDLIRQITWLHIRYEPDRGQLFIACSRGGYPVRQQVSEHFARLLLDVHEPPTVSQAEAFELTPLLCPDALTPPPGQAECALKLVRICVRHWAYPGTMMEFARKTGLEANFLERLFGDHAGSVVIEAATLRFENYRVAQTDELRSFTATFNRDGSTTFDGNKIDQRRLREDLPRLWKLAGAHADY